MYVIKNKSKHPLYRRWSAMKQRCYHKNNPAFKYYGAKGVTVCAEWLNNFEQFVQDMFPSFKEGMHIDRIDNNKGYFKENCQWLTPKENCTKDNVLGINQYTVSGKYIKSYRSMAEACLAINLKFNHGGLNRAHKQRKPFKEFRWFRKDNKLDLLPMEMDGILINKGSKILQLNKGTNTIIKEWSTMQDACNALGISSASMSQTCKGKRKSAGGFGWQYR